MGDGRERQPWERAKIVREAMTVEKTELGKSTKTLVSANPPLQVTVTVNAVFAIERAGVSIAVATQEEAQFLMDHLRTAKKHLPAGGSR